MTLAIERADHRDADKRYMISKVMWLSVEALRWNGRGPMPDFRADESERMEQ
ncbi:hypothetical protein [Actinomadura rubrisoli]|uniref:hypothetical protein n=1 Tax=Actinomadura rubrisoli TaxID=2530368 RepID=UPI001404888B|nr:hypothetical protein [Actinomadura rubrisoli]